MLIIGCDFHTLYQQIAMAREETGEPLVERRLAGGAEAKPRDESWVAHPRGHCKGADFGVCF
ncbi:MAG TPA: hypothetical protein VJN93_05455 [Candidatus Acidoferrum sp.]|nr:hypothetical protein [Candidatus Acidoferrum sp.]